MSNFPIQAAPPPQFPDLRHPLADGAVLYDKAQNLTPEEKLRARENIGAVTGGVSDVADLTTRTLTAGNMLRVAAAGGFEERTPAEVLVAIGAETAGSAAAAQAAAIAASDPAGSAAAITAASIGAAAVNHYHAGVYDPAGTAAALTPAAIGAEPALNFVPADSADLGTAAALDTGVTEGTIPVLGVDNKIPSALLPAIVLTETVLVADSAARLALTLAEAAGKIVVDADTGESYGLVAGGVPATPGDWLQVGDRDITPADVGAEPALGFTPADVTDARFNRRTFAVYSLTWETIDLSLPWPHTIVAGHKVCIPLSLTGDRGIYVMDGVGALTLETQVFDGTYNESILSAYDQYDSAGVHLPVGSIFYIHTTDALALVPVGHNRVVAEGGGIVIIGTTNPTFGGANTGVNSVISGQGN